MSRSKTVQIIPGGGWAAVYMVDGQQPHFREIAFWALDDHGDTHAFDGETPEPLSAELGFRAYYGPAEYPRILQVLTRRHDALIGSKEPERGTDEWLLQVAAEHDEWHRENKTGDMCLCQQCRSAWAIRREREAAGRKAAGGAR